MRKSRDPRTNELVTHAKSGSVAEVETLLKQGCNPNQPDNQGQLAIYAAFDANKTDVVKLLLLNGAKVKPSDNRVFWTPLTNELVTHAKSGSVTEVETLLKQGCNPNQPDDQGQLAIDAAINASKTEVVKLLLLNGAKVKPSDNMVFWKKFWTTLSDDEKKNFISKIPESVRRIKLVKDDVGVVVVHGIGTSKQNETLVSWTEAIRKIRNQDREEVEKCIPSDVSLHESSASLRIEDGKVVKFVESWWAELFRAPDWGKFLKWCFVAVPTALVAQFDERYRRAIHHYQSNQKKFALLELLVEFLVLLIGLVLSPLLILILLLLSILKFVPQIKGFIDIVQTVLTGYIGDSLVFNEDEIRRSGIINKVRSDIEAVRASSKRCIVLAHSQGAAVAHAAIKGLEASDTRLDFISFGSGLRKLRELSEYQKTGRKFAWLSTVFAFISVVLFALAGWARPDYPVFYIILLFGYSIFVCGGVLFFRITFEKQGLKLLGITLINKPEDPEVSDKARSKKFNWNGWYFIVVISFLLWLILPYSGPLILTYIVPLFSTESSIGWLISTYIVTFLNELTSLDRLFILFCPPFIGLAFTYLMDWRYKVGRSTTRDDYYRYEVDRWENDYRIPVKQLKQWVDFYANYDPVPNGPLFDQLSSITNPNIALNYRAIPIVNSLSMISDHVEYWKNDKQFVKPVADLIYGQPPKINTKSPALHISSPWEFLGRLGTVVWVGLVFILNIDVFPKMLPSISIALVRWLKGLKEGSIFEWLLTSCSSYTSHDISDIPDLTLCKGSLVYSVLETSLEYGLVPIVFIFVLWLGRVGIRELLKKQLAGQ